MAENTRSWTLGQSLPIRRAGPGDAVAVLGLGRFGGAVASELVRLGCEVLGVDHSERTVQAYAPILTQVVQADFTEAEVLRQLGVGEMSFAVVAVGSDREASILATAALDELGVRVIWAKAVSRQHGRILERVGAHRVVYPNTTWATASPTSSAGGSSSGSSSTNASPSSRPSLLRS